MPLSPLSKAPFYRQLKTLPEKNLSKLDILVLDSTLSHKILTTKSSAYSKLTSKPRNRKCLNTHHHLVLNVLQEIAAISILGIHPQQVQHGKSKTTKCLHSAHDLELHASHIQMRKIQDPESRIRLITDSRHLRHNTRSKEYNPEPPLRIQSKPPSSHSPTDGAPTFLAWLQSPVGPHLTHTDTTYALSTMTWDELLQNERKAALERSVSVHRTEYSESLYSSQVPPSSYSVHQG